MYQFLDIESFVGAHHIPSYRIEQFNRAIYQNYISSFDALTTWSNDLRELVKTSMLFSTIEPLQELSSKDGNTTKILFRRKSDGKQFETVLMRHSDGRHTVCVSSMIGCPVGCTFCATGKMGFLGSLSTQEIIDQILHVARMVKEEKEAVSNIVFMGMGEPLLNLQSVEDAIAIITDPKKMAMSERRITISTSGITDKLQQLIAHGYKGRLALSLHAPNQELRERIMPIAKKYPLENVLHVMSEFAQKTNKRVSYEYILIDGINDTEKCAYELAQCMDPKLSHINLIPYNPIEGSEYRRSSRRAIENFASVLQKYHIQHTIRITMGDDIKAACGQLATKN